jgi:hypothetical protein
MKKFECDYCAKPCVLTFDSGCSNVPRFCPYLTTQPTKWHEVKEDSAENAQTTNEQFGNSEQLPKLTVEVFDRPDCPEWANYASVNKNGRVIFFEDKNSPGVKADIGFFDTSDWQNSLIERPKKLEVK